MVGSENGVWCCAECKDVMWQSAVSEKHFHLKLKFVSTLHQSSHSLGCTTNFKFGITNTEL